MKRATRVSTTPSRVAENSSRCASGDVLSRISVISSAKPISAMWSASSSTVIRTWLRSALPRRMRSLRRPGVATSTCTPRSSDMICLDMDSPPAISRLHVGQGFDGVVRESSRDIGHHVTQFSSSGQHLCLNVHAVLGEYLVHGGEHARRVDVQVHDPVGACLLYTSPSP